MKRLIFSIDIEQDISKYLNDSYIGIEKGMPGILDLFSREKITAEFFITGEICEKYPELAHSILDNGHTLGCHGYNHRIENYCLKSFKLQHQDIKKATDAIENIVGLRPKTFRTPNFSFNENTLKSLRILDYKIDSSILPGRAVKKWRFYPVLNFKDAPRYAYHPDETNVCKIGNSPVWEIPLTENALSPGNPVGMGYLNVHGANNALSVIENAKSPYTIFLIHPWELVDLGVYYPKLRNWVKESSKMNLNVLIEFLKNSKDRFIISSIQKEAGLAEKTN